MRETKGFLYSPRIFRSPRANYYADEMLECLDVYTEHEIQQIHDEGFDCIWLHVVLRNLCPTDLYAGHVEKDQERIERLNSLVERCGRHDVGVWLYLNEPRAFPRNHPFWDEHPGCKGQPDISPMEDMASWPETLAMCTSSPPVKQFLRESVAMLFRRVPGLRGCFAITASEHHTSCISHADPAQHADPDKFHCRRCAERSSAEIISEILTLMDEGAREATAEPGCIVAWDWGWRHVSPDTQALFSSLPDGMPVLMDFERGAHVKRGGQDIFADEYSLGISGPSEQFLEHKAFCVDAGRPYYAKLQVGTTHELGSVPNLPVPGSIFRKFRAMEEQGVRGYLGTWNFGNFRTLNTRAVGILSRGVGRWEDEAHFTRWLAGEYFGLEADADSVVEAWEGFSAALECHPMEIPFLYSSPITYGPIYPLKESFDGTQMPPNWYMLKMDGDRLEDTTGCFSLDGIESLLSEMCEKWRAALESYEQGLSGIEPESPRARSELDSARGAGLLIRSCRNIYRWYLAKKGSRGSYVLKGIASDELACCTELLPIVERDDRIGFHAEPQIRYVTPEKLREKIASLQRTLERL